MLHLLVALCSATPQATGVRTFAMLAGRLAFDAPAYWGPAGPPSSDSLGTIIFCIPNAVIEGTGVAANVVVEAHVSGSPIDLKVSSDTQLAKLTAAFPVTVLLDSTRLGKFRIVARRSQERATVYNVNDIYAVSGNVLVHCMIALPSVRAISVDWYGRVIQELNRMLFSLTLHGRPLLPTDLRVNALPH